MRASAEGDEVGVSYDPLLAKLIAHGDATGRRRSPRSPGLSTRRSVEGVTTNLPFLRWLVRHPAFLAGEATTAFLIEHAPLSPAPLRPRPSAFSSPWRLNLPAPPPAPAPDADQAGASRLGGGHGTLSAPMPGTVIAVAVAVGDEVEASRPLVVLEAMKMEMPVTAPFAATVTAVHVAAGDRVAAARLSSSSAEIYRTAAAGSPLIARSSAPTATLTSHITITAPT